MLATGGPVVVVILARKTPRTFYRWKSFWLGLFVACFLAWAWWDSMRFISGVSWREIHAGNSGGGVFLEHRSPSSGAIGPVADFQWVRFPMNFLCPSGVQIPAFSRPLLLRGGGNEDAVFEPGYPWPTSYLESMRFMMNLQPSRDWHLIIPHWLVLLTFGVPWSGLLIWRGWRMKRIGSPDRAM